MYVCDFQERKDSVAKLKSSVLNLVDLAGSERQRDAHTAGVRLKVQFDARIVCQLPVLSA